MKYLPFILVSIVCLSSCGEPISQPEGMLNENLDCPKGSNGRYDRHGGMGTNQWVHSCKKNDGAYHVWRNEVIIIEGAFNNGKETGTWIYRDKDGNVTKTINYDVK